MTLVRLIGNFHFTVEQATPGGLGKWRNVRYTMDPVPECDYVIALNYDGKSHQVVCPKEHCWALIQEPDTKMHRHLHTSHRSFSRLYSCDENLTGGHRTLSPPYLQWYSTRDYDTLKAATIPDKTGLLSTVTSDIKWLKGHRLRFRFLKELWREVEFDWFGRGVRQLSDKWDGLAPYRYSMAFENHRSNYYWTEKIADCFLSWTMPIYYGSPKITEYFPPESMIQIDINKPEEAKKMIEDTIRSGVYEKNFDAICEARRLVLERYSALAFLTGEIERHQESLCDCQPRPLHIPGRPPPITRLGKVGYALKYSLEKYLKRPIPALWMS